MLWPRAGDHSRQLPRWDRAYVDPAPVGKVNRRSKDHLVALLDSAGHLDRCTEIAHHIDRANAGDSVLDHCNVEAASIEDDRVGWNDQGWCLARDFELDGAIETRRKLLIRIGHVDLGQEGSGVQL